MSSISNYEISLWKKIRATATVEGEVKHYFYDKKIAVIGANDLDADEKVFDPILTEQTDGSIELTFKLHKTFYDINRGTIVASLLAGVIVNESLIKLYYKGEWLDFVVKGISENTEDNTLVYTCKDLYVHELSKIGYNVILDVELENNIGTVTELATTILEGTDWTVDTNNSDIIMQKVPATLYRGVALDDIAVTQLTNDYVANTTIIPTGAIFYYFHTDYYNRQSTIQIVYDPSEIYDDDEYLLYNIDNFTMSNITYVENNNIIEVYQNGGLIFANNSEPISLFQAERVIITQVSQYEGNKNQYVLKYKDSQDNIVFGHTETEYITNTTVQNFITNNKEFTDLAGYITQEGLDFETYIYPEYNASTSQNLINWLNASKTRYLKTLFTSTNSIICNTGIIDNRSEIDHFTLGDNYTFRIKYDVGSAPGVLGSGIKAKICKYSIVDSEFILDENNVYFTFDHLTLQDGYLTQLANCLKTCTYQDLPNVGLFLYVDAPNGTNYYFLEDIQFFKTIYNVDNVQIFPDTLTSSEAKTKYIYYNLIPGTTGEEAINYLYQGYSPSTDYTPIYDNDYNKITSISGKESNCFNLLQNLAETFECWLKISVDHDATGAVSLDANYNPIKKVSFKRYFGVDNFSGFHYEINLKGISRNLISDDIVTKLIVRNNNNEYIEDGVCSISNAPTNISKETVIYNFNYYINKGLLEPQTVLQDLYGFSSTDLGYLFKLGQYNTTYAENTTKLVAISANLLKLDAQKIAYTEAVAAAEQEILKYKNELFVYLKKRYTYEQVIAGAYSALLTDQSAQNYITSIQNLEAQKVKYSGLLLNVENQIIIETNNQTTYTLANEIILNQKEALHLAFYKIYAPFIKEAEWSEDTYIDPDLYYLDANMVLNNSSFPAVEYTINVIDVSRQAGLELFDFNIGDKTFIQDEEFFGYIIINGVTTPYRQPVTISKLERYLDDPSQNKITIKTYKHNFKDLFQQLTAATQSLTFAQGSYNRAANAITPTGEMKVSVLQNTIANNSLTLMNSHNESVIWDDSGITITDLLNNNRKVRMVSGGIFISNDGGTNWTSGITAGGINTSLLTTGRLDVNKIFIVNENIPTFQWTADGISAYKWANDGSYDLSTFIRLDQYGLYGVQNGSENFKPIGATVEDRLLSIQNNAKFALLWDGFFLKSTGTDAYLKISSDYDLQMFQNVSQSETPLYRDKITLGRLGGGIYGLRLKHDDDTIALVTTSEGDLVLNGIINILPEELETNASIQLGIIYTDENKTVVKEYFAVKQNNDYKFQIDGEGNVFIAGEIVATSGTIGGFTIGPDSLYSTDGRVVISPTALTFYDKVSLSDRIKVFDFSINQQNVASLSLEGNINITGESVLLGSLRVGPTTRLNEQNEEIPVDYIVIDGQGEIYHTSYQEGAGTTGFKIDKTGKISATSIELGRYASIKDYLKMGDSYIFNPTVNADKFLSVNINDVEYASLDNKGVLNVKRIIIDGAPEAVTVNNVVYNTNTIIGNLDILGNLQVGSNGIIMNGTSGAIYSQAYAENDNTGWQIKADGTATFNNAIIRGKLQTTVFERSKVASVGGRLLISPSIQLEDAITGLPPDLGLVEFKFITYINDGTPEETYNKTLYDLWSPVNNALVDLGETILEGCIINHTDPTQEAPNTWTISVFIPTSSLVNLGTELSPIYQLPLGTIIISTNTETNSIELNVDEFGPHIHMSAPEEQAGTVYLGALEGMPNTYFPEFSGYGLYGENVYLTGKFYLPNAGMTNEGEADTDVRIWAGSDPADRANAPFYVTKEGFVHASYGEFSGRVRNTTLETSAIVGSNGLGVYGDSAINFYSGIVEVDTEGNITGDTTLKLKIDSDGLTGVNTNFLFQSYLNSTYLDLFKVDSTTGITTINSLRLNGDITLGLNTNKLTITYGSNFIDLSETELTTPMARTNKMTIEEKLYFGDSQVYYLGVKNESNENIGYDIYILN